MRQIILSYDYELFFGFKSGTVLKTLIEPTNLLLDSMDKYGQKGNFFVDWQTLKYLQEANTERTLSDYLLIENQLKDIVRRGHRIELHIHPHWVDAKYNGDGTWDYSNFSHYSLYSFPQEEVTKMFIDGANLLNMIAQKVDPEYRVVAFRAGGWAVQPFDKLKNGFEQAGIRIDSSVAQGAFCKSHFFEYDFRHADVAAGNFYRFEDDVIKEQKDGHFVEVPISSYQRGFINKLYDKIFRILFKKWSTPITDGTHDRDDLDLVQERRIAMVTMSTMCPLSVIRSLRLANKSIITIIDHPKDYTHSVPFCLWILSKFCKSITYKDIEKIL